MSEQVLRNGNAMYRSRTRTITQIAMLGAVAGVLMNLEFPIPFLAPSFYQLDFSEIPVLVGSFAMGPVAGVVIELVKILVHLGNQRNPYGRSGRSGQLYLRLYLRGAGGNSVPSASCEEQKTRGGRNGRWVRC